ncbi:MAG: T9SS type A sorting domain-containing protein [Flavobacteriales bacterium]|nr:T9SS type A sorting domain-containing protein [Flavobacteriales bacterium]
MAPTFTTPPRWALWPRRPNDNTDLDGVNGYDPNDKTVSPTELTPAEVSASERVTYTVRFQNTGTYQATRVVITDTLSSDLQWNTMHLIAASHAHTWYMENGVLFVVFDNINLPDSNANEPESHGFVKFSMKPVNTLMLGASVSNTANIYFDFNEPVITNAAVFTVDDNTATMEVALTHMQLSPNPVSDALTVIFAQPQQGALLEVVDVTGRVVLATVVSGTQAVLDVQGPESGQLSCALG